MSCHIVAQLDLFAGTHAAAAPTAAAAPVSRAEPGLDVLAEALRQEAAGMLRRSFLQAVQLRLAGQGLWGFPNLIRNPGGPWRERQGLLLHWPTTIACWPASYVVRADGDGVQHITLRVRPGADANPAVPRAAAALADLGPVSLVPSTLMIEAYEAF